MTARPPKRRRKAREWTIHDPAIWAHRLEICPTPLACDRIKGQETIIVREVVLPRRQRRGKK